MYQIFVSCKLIYIFEFLAIKKPKIEFLGTIYEVMVPYIKKMIRGLPAWILRLFNLGTSKIAIFHFYEMKNDILIFFARPV